MKQRVLLLKKKKKWCCFEGYYSLSSTQKQAETTCLGRGFRYHFFFLVLFQWLKKLAFLNLLLKEDPVSLVSVLLILWYICKADPNRLTRPAMTIHDSDFWPILVEILPIWIKSQDSCPKKTRYPSFIPYK